MKSCYFLVSVPNECQNPLELSYIGFAYSYLSASSRKGERKHLRLPVLSIWKPVRLTIVMFLSTMWLGLIDRFCYSVDTKFLWLNSPPLCVLQSDSLLQWFSFTHLPSPSLYPRHLHPCCVTHISLKLSCVLANFTSCLMDKTSLNFLPFCFAFILIELQSMNISRRSLRSKFSL